MGFFCAFRSTHLRRNSSWNSSHWCRQSGMCPVPSSISIWTSLQFADLSEHSWRVHKIQVSLFRKGVAFCFMKVQHSVRKLQAFMGGAIVWTAEQLWGGSLSMQDWGWWWVLWMQLSQWSWFDLWHRENVDGHYVLGGCRCWWRSGPCWWRCQLHWGVVYIGG